MTFIVRISGDETGGVAGVVEHVRSGRKERFDGVEGIGRVIAAFIQGAGAPERPGGSDAASPG